MVGDFEVHSSYDDEQAQEIILNVYVDSYKMGDYYLSSLIKNKL